ncbi:hypothetical protein BB559_003864 [Furculomyces boomerangus]|uniref:Flavodoxin-like fold domain-containing protein n=2 Tax=Harpellales TaxID=61421 RepID=A0A2T9YI78_9FUNG|nr:hypothetical protein BB559_003864 [Furculomyces boomerangus]PWA01525.1 hypothetical protein BB558_002355 [Smittium angustum]
MRKVLIINGNPDSESFCHALHESYKKGSLKGNNEVREITLSEMKFNSTLMHGYRKRTEFEPDLLEAWENIKWADHIVCIYPTWWGTLPALMKGFFDRVFLPGLAFKYVETSPFPEKLLKGKTSEIISTMDTPVWYYKYIKSDVGGRLLRDNILNFCGIVNKRTTYLAVMRDSTPEQRKGWLERVEKLGSK